MMVRVMKDEAEKKIENLDRNTKSIFKLVKFMQEDGTDIEGVSMHKR